MTAAELIAFEKRVADAFQKQQIKGPIHLSGGNEQQLIEIFKDVDPGDWVFSTYRSHYHALLHGIDQEWLFEEILAGRSMGIHCPEHCFFSSAIVGGCLPIAVGVAAAMKRQGVDHTVWCFVGDMAATTGAFREAATYAIAHWLPIRFIVENNEMSCDTPTLDTWNDTVFANLGEVYDYIRTYPHSGTGAYVF